MAVGIIEILISVIIILLIIYYRNLTKNYGFWKLRGIPGPTPIPMFGTIKDVVFAKYSIGNYLKNIYDEYPNEPMVGVFARSNPVLVLNDLNLIKTILIRDFKNFMARGLKMHEKHQPLTAHLFLIEPKRWRPLRTKLTPAFTSGKLKDMFYLLNECADKLDKYLDNFNGKIVDVREIASKFTIDVIGVCVFGLQTNALEDENSTFTQMGKRIFHYNWKNILRFRIRNFAPRLYELVGGWLVDHEINNFFINLTRDTIEYRKNNDINRHDFIDLLAALKNETNKFDDIELTDSLIAAQLYVFFAAGFETSSSTISNCLFELALNRDVQTKVRNEIEEELEKTCGNITYDLIDKMKYLDKVLNETLRKYPPVTTLMRRSTTAYTFPNTNVSIPIGTSVYIPIFAIHRDPKYFPNPDIFDPDRFNEEEVSKRPPMTFLPFGDGPRNCIGLRFGRMQTKVGLVKILQNYIVDVCEETEKDYKIDNGSFFLLVPIGGIMLRISKPIL